ncbi:tRNA (adenosine(37)-N6)-threonylcarbamoyltransferase complex transferase subunit TsaD [Candidatus Pacearchaeota archaeon]|nr:tRNA (adenosine(37)-N6)-threonylcarbamoyltransferase complex transferase subunit TsaD [Candidatus Pacearchaeota archaeon]
MKYILGVESTAHTFGVAVLNWGGKILSNIKDSYTTEKGGMIPLEVRRHHKEVAPVVYDEALKEAGITEEEIEAIALSNAPGLAPCLLEGMAFAKRLAKRLGVPIVGVNHCVAHLVIGESVGAKDPVMLYASGANTQVVAFEGGKFRVFGETLDLGVGNFIDTVARNMGLGFPGGPRIQQLAVEFERSEVRNQRSEIRGQRSESGLLELSYSVKGMDVSFSGIQTQIRNLIEKGENFGRIAYSMQEVIFAMLVEAAERALAHTGKKELLLGGGVACNSRLQEMCKIMCKERGAKFFCPDRGLLVDNGAMIGYLGLKMYKAGIFERDLDKVDISPRERTDDIEVLWK